MNINFQQFLDIIGQYSAITIEPSDASAFDIANLAFSSVDDELKSIRISYTNNVGKAVHHDLNENNINHIKLENHSLTFDLNSENYSLDCLKSYSIPQSDSTIDRLLAILEDEADCVIFNNILAYPGVNNENFNDEEDPEYESSVEFSWMDSQGGRRGRKCSFHQSDIKDLVIINGQFNFSVDSKPYTVRPMKALNHNDYLEFLSKIEQSKLLQMVNENVPAHASCLTI